MVASNQPFSSTSGDPNLTPTPTGDPNCVGAKHLRPTRPTRRAPLLVLPSSLGRSLSLGGSGAGSNQWVGGKIDLGNPRSDQQLEGFNPG